jgi:hypothetical protein
MSSFWEQEVFKKPPEFERNPNIVCQHCHTKGGISLKEVTNKKGISGGKAAAALLTCGVSLFAVGLSRKEKQMQAHCEFCKLTYYI